MDNRVKEITLISLLAVIIFISGSFKVPGIIPGTEFQMSAPIAIAICAVFGFKKYILSGIVASIISLVLGTHTILNVAVAMTFRVVAGGIISILGNNFLVLAIAGPMGTFIGRIVMSFITGTPLKVLLFAAIPGMIYTAATAYILYKIVMKIVKVTPYENYIKKEMG